HLQSVADLAAKFAAPFGGEEWARLAGLWHDIGKYSNEFQHMLYEANGIESHLETKPGKPIHSQAGGHLAQQKFANGMDRVFCWLIMGHHAGLADFGSDMTGAKALQPKMMNPNISDEILSLVPDKIKDQPQPEAPTPLHQGADVSFFIRMLFSCVVDADFLDTEAFMDKKREKLRNDAVPNLVSLLKSFDRYMDNICQSASPTQINAKRAVVLEQCRQAANDEPGVFSLTVPTGGGKTLSSLAFALRHAVKYQKRRIIYVIPYTSIIEQTASVFRKVPGFDRAVLEHHSNVATEDETRESVRSRLASENWDAPIIVTTAVQFFESLYASKTSRCRKLHNIASSVVIFDEAQCLPPAYLRPIVFAIRELQRHYGVTPVLCTATQPVLTQTKSFDFNFKEGFEAVKEIIDDPAALSNDLQRVFVETLSDLAPVSYDQIAQNMLAENQSVLCIVNRKDDARSLAELLPESQTIHLSTNLCAAHRLKILKTIESRLKADAKPLFVVSTSLVEAGVDLDFPIVYRALAGLDSIAQAAGRCNREGKLAALGKTIVFAPEKQPTYVQSAASLAREYMKPSQLGSIFQTDTFQHYFEQRFFQLGEDALDEKGILALFSGNLNFSYRTAADRFRLIDDDWQLPLIVPYADVLKLVNDLIDWNSRTALRKLQRYTIGIPKKLMWHLIDEAHAHELPGFPGTYILDTKALYNDHFGFLPPDGIEAYDPNTTII
ncbi:MAG: CRISPR-associated endonuclease Cas3'', partial [Deltaproteobacteria bacterium]|nr:CRISPR-associated endonuclease Cas3'' [Deltaproteobacteria bacterium]